jgi:hypothetical protein
MESTVTSYYSEWSLTGSSTTARLVSGLEVIELDSEPQTFDFISFLATAQALNIRLLPISWQEGIQDGGFGATSTIKQAHISKDRNFAFKRIHERFKRESSKRQIYRSLVSEISVLGQIIIREELNISPLLGICWDISPRDHIPWPVLVFETASHGNLFDFVASAAGRELDLEERLNLCSEIGSVIHQMHFLGR